MKTRGPVCCAEALEARRLLAHPAFLFPTSYNGGTGPVAADFSGDGKLDLAVVDSYSNRVSVLSNRGSGTFADPISYPTDVSPTSLAPADFNNDGKIDLAAALFDGTASRIRIMLNDGRGSLVTLGDFGSTGPVSSLASGDFDGNGYTDLAVCVNAQDGRVNILLNTGLGTFVGNVPYSTRASPSSVQAADFNGDGSPDLAVCQPSDNSIRILFNSGNGAFTPAADYIVGTYINPLLMSVADFTGDEKPDFAASNSHGTVFIFRNNGDGSFAPKVGYGTSVIGGALYTTFTTGDFDGDGSVDLAAQNFGSYYGNPLTLVLNKGDGTFGTPIDYPFKLSLYPSLFSAAELNGDRRDDLIFGGPTVLLSSGPSLVAPRIDYQADARPGSIVAGDFNRDGRTDLVVDHAGVYLNNGDQTFTRLLHSSGVLFTYPQAVADFNGDGILDLVTDRYWGLGVQFGNGDGTFGAYTGYLTASGSTAPGFQVVVADLNGDGAPDLAATAYRSTSTTILLNDGSGTLVPASSYPFSGEIVAADFSGNGSVDLAISTATQVQLLINSGSGTFVTGGAYSAGRGGLRAADFDRNGRIDIAVGTQTSLYILRNLGGGAFSIVSYPYAGASLAVGDFNLDGRPDLALADLPGQNLKLLLNNGKGAFPSALGYATGGYPRSIITTEFNNDRKPDLAWVNMMSNSLSVMLNIAPLPERYHGPLKVAVVRPMLQAIQASPSDRPLLDILDLPDDALALALAR
jgi:hypothetical protein